MTSILVQQAKDHKHEHIYVCVCVSMHVFVRDKRSEEVTVGPLGHTV